MLAVDRWIKKHPDWFDQPRIDIEDGHERGSSSISVAVLIESRPEL
jgi:hypothetical protein